MDRPPTLILVVDDEPLIREVLARALESPDRRVLVAVDIADAQRQRQAAGRLDIALIDKNLANESGLELIRALKERDPDAAYILMTAYASLDSAVESVRLGLFDYVLKPFDLDVVEALVARAERAVTDARTAVAERAAAEHRFAQQSSHDPLTGFLNREAFVARLDESLAELHLAPARGFAVLVVDINDFGRINDTFGHTAGDALLVQWSARLRTHADEHTVVARLGGDQFTLLLDGAATVDQAMSAFERLQRTLAEPFSVGEQEVRTNVSAGICLAAADYQRGEELLRDAGTALVQAKLEGRRRVVVFAHEMRHRAVDRLTLDQGLRLAIERHEFVAHYQPIVSLESGRVVAFEALARWRHPERGLVAPAYFLERAAETGILAEISWQVANLALAQQRAWRRQFSGRAPVAMCINVAPPLLMRSSFVRDLEALLLRHDLAAADVKIEVTEVVALDNTPAPAAVVQALRRLGIVVCLDDFGTGYASLSWLHRFPVDELKIDRSFVSGMLVDRRSQVLVGAAVNLAHSLGLPVVAEGIETEAQLAELRAAACEYGQGFLFARPLAENEAGRLLAEDRPLPRS